MDPASTPRPPPATALAALIGQSLSAERVKKTVTRLLRGIAR